MRHICSEISPERLGKYAAKVQVHGSGFLQNHSKASSYQQYTMHLSDPHVSMANTSYMQKNNQAKLNEVSMYNSSVMLLMQKASLLHNILLVPVNFYPQFIQPPSISFECANFYPKKFSYLLGSCSHFLIKFAFSMLLYYFLIFVHIFLILQRDSTDAAMQCSL